MMLPLRVHVSSSSGTAFVYMRHVRHASLAELFLAKSAIVRFELSKPGLPLLLGNVIPLLAVRALFVRVKALPIALGILAKSA